MTNSVIDTYSRLAEQYDDPRNRASCWGQITDVACELVTFRELYKTIVDVGCGTGQELVRLAAKYPVDVQLTGVEPADNMRTIARARAGPFRNVRILDGRFEDLPLESQSVDYLYSILAFHWTTDVERSVAELARVLKPAGEFDLTFIGRDNGHEFIRKTTPIFFRFMTPAQMVEAASMRKQLTRLEALSVFRRHFANRSGLAVEESYHTYFDTLEGHWSWWVRVEGQFVRIPADRRIACDQAVKAALGALATERGIPYTVHLLHVRLHNV
jgi:ubiquinone/menaquinone biosynthesis C-methylase UbiE